MLKFWFFPQYRSAHLKLQAMGILFSNKNADYQIFSAKFIGKQNVETFLDTSFKIIYEQKITNIKCIKMLAFVHSAVSLIKDLKNLENISKFLSFLLKYVQKAEQQHKNQKISFELSQQVKENSNKQQFQFTISSTTRNKALDDNSKKLFLVKNLLRPYLSYLFKLLANYQFYWQCKTKKPLTFQQSWKIINFFKSIEVLSKNFINVGRYFGKQFERLIVLLTQLLTRDVERFYGKLKSALKESAALIEYNYSIACQKYTTYDLYDHLDFEGLDDTVRIFEELTTLNESIYNLYTNKYYQSKLSHLIFPDILSTSHKDYDFLFHIWKIKNRIDQQKKKKGLKSTDPLFSSQDVSNVEFQFSFTNPETIKKKLKQ